MRDPTTTRIREDAVPLRTTSNLDQLVERVGAARVVLLGESSHGTSEYYRQRTEITRRLVEEKGFSLVAVVGDWPDALAMHRCALHGPGASPDPREALAEFSRWPEWIWANEEMAGFLRWLRLYNAELAPSARAGLFGLDGYNLWRSLHAVLEYLHLYQPDHVNAALAAYRCFVSYAEDPQDYAWPSGLVPASQELTVVRLLAELRRHAADTEAGTSAFDRGFARFAADYNVELAANAERYYRTLLKGGADAWNAREHHMLTTLDRLLRHHGPLAKAVVWAHNTHVGDARATAMGRAGMVTLSQLIRARYGADEVVAVGFGSYAGSVLAADAWGAPARQVPVPPPLTESVESRLHEALSGGGSLFVFPRAPEHRSEWLRAEFGHRAIGLVYRPELEHWGNYVPTVLGDCYDAFIYSGRTHALTPVAPGAATPGEHHPHPSGV
ncbi:erythromycin esterase family protein [Salinactinospora qingdaonensis]|uniref:Erythromycin esterase homolog n=1 Tax=Salinactinospora qingdaonensis TaxID=702744 RepID=A0ABP7FAL0_9ACTN